MNINNPLCTKLECNNKVKDNLSNFNFANQLSEQMYHKLVQALYNRLYFQLYDNINSKVLAVLLRDEHK